MRTHNTPRLCAGPQTAGTPIKFWNVASIGDDEGEITLYGDVVSRQPVDWWTGEPEPGLYIAPESFMEDLAAVKGKSNITIKINSCGGDLYTGIAIHNAIKGLTGHKVGGVEGIAASAASVIACAGDEVQVYPGSMVMIHGVAGLLYDYYTLADLKKLQKDFDASERAIAEIYHAKTGLEVDQLRSMMTRETWMVGQEAIDNGFADTLLTDEGPDVTLSADKKVLLVAGIRHDVKGFRHIPGTIPIDNSIHAAPAAGNKHAAAKNDGPKKEDNKTMTLEEMRAQHPDVVAQIEQQAAETARTQERARIEAIDRDDILAREPELLQFAFERMPSLLVGACDVLVVDETGKNYSGTGVDPNITGTFSTEYAHGGVEVQRTCFLDLSAASHGNALGVGLANVITKRFFDKIDTEKMYPNCLTSTVLTSARIPCVVANDREAIQMCIRTCTGIDRSRARIIRIPNSLHIGRIMLSEAYYRDVKAGKWPGVAACSEPEPLEFDGDGALLTPIEG